MIPSNQPYIPTLVIIAGFDAGTNVSFGLASFSSAVAFAVTKPKREVPFGESPRKIMLPSGVVPV